VPSLTSLLLKNTLVAKQSLQKVTRRSGNNARLR